MGKSVEHLLHVCMRSNSGFDWSVIMKMKKNKNFSTTSLEVVESIVLIHGFDVGTRGMRGIKDNFSVLT